MSFLEIIAEFGDGSDRNRTAVHSGNMGDVVYSLPTIKALGVDRLVLNLVDDPGIGGRRLDRQSAEFLVPLLLAQPGLRSIAIASAPARFSVRLGQKDGERLVSRGMPLEQVSPSALGVDYCLDRFRLLPADEMHLIESHARAQGIAVDGRRPFLELEGSKEGIGGESIVLSLTPRYRHLPAAYFIELLDGLGPVQLIGRPEEFQAYRGIAGTFVTAADSLDLARMIQRARLFVGTPSLPYAIAEGLKVRRIVDVPVWPLNAFPVGLDGWVLPTNVRAAKAMVEDLLRGDRPRLQSVPWRLDIEGMDAEATPTGLQAQLALSSDETFSEENVQFVGVEFAGTRQLVRVPIPALSASMRTLGLGLNGYNGWLGLAALHISDANGEILWAADAADLLRAAIDYPAITLRASDDPAEILWDQFDARAHLILPLPSDCLEGLRAGGDLTFVLRAVPPSAWPPLYRTLKSEVNDLAHHALSHAKEMVLAEEQAKTAGAVAEHRQRQVESLLHSSSWRVTAPLRSATRLLARWTAALRTAAGTRTTADSSPVPGGISGAPLDPAPATPWEVWRHEGAAALARLLGSRARLDFRISGPPQVSIILVLYNQAHLTLGCLRSIQDCAGVPCELIIVDNASRDETAALLDRIDGATIIRNASNLGFLRAVNQAARSARAPFMLLLNNDARLLSGSLSEALYRFQEEGDIGAVGGQIILPDGSLQEAGSIIWRDGSCLGYARGKSPKTPEAMFMRDVDYVSGAFLLTRTVWFKSLGGFDPAFEPAYYEETDYCMRLRAAGRRVVYDPRVQIHHYEFGSATQREAALQLQREHQVVFRRRHQDTLKIAHLPPDERSLVFARARPPKRGRVLIIDDRIPDPSQGAGYPRALTILRLIEAAGYFVTHYPLRTPSEEWSTVYRVVPRTVEVMLEYGLARLSEFLRARVGFYSTIVVSRPHNMEELEKLLIAEPTLLGGAQIIYDAEAIFAVREQLRAEAQGQPWTKAEADERIGRELHLADRAHVILAVSRRDAAHFAALGHQTVHVLGHRVEPRPDSTPIEERRGMLFVGRLEDEGSPNVDAVLWFADHVLPEIESRLGWLPPLHLVGRAGAPSLQKLRERSGIHLHGAQDDLQPWYASARLFIAPTRYASGIPHKVHEAAAHGLPCVVSSLLAEQLEWEDSKELLVGESVAGFAEACVRLLRDDGLWQDLRVRALSRLATDCSEAYFQKTLTSILAEKPPTDGVSGSRSEEGREDFAGAQDQLP